MSTGGEEKIRNYSELLSRIAGVEPGSYQVMIERGRGGRPRRLNMVVVTDGDTRGLAYDTGSGLGSFLDIDSFNGRNGIRWAKFVTPRT